MTEIGVENRANHGNDDTVHMMNNHEWTEEQKRKLVEIDRQERRRKNFMKSVKARWDSEYLESRKTAQNLTDNARRFKKEGWGRPAELDN